MDQNAPITTPEPTPEPIVEPKTELVPEPKPVVSSTNGIISLVTGILTWVIFFFRGTFNISVILAGVIAFISAVLAIFFGARAKRENRASIAGKIGQILGWIYIVGGILVILAIVLGISAIAGLIK